MDFTTDSEFHSTLKLDELPNISIAQGSVFVKAFSQMLQTISVGLQ
jgi:hypothetical protein